MSLKTRVEILELTITKLPEISTDIKWIKRIGYYLVGAITVHIGMGFL
jgi:hypothetical protein